MITKRSPTPPALFPESVVDDLQKDPDVKRVTGRFETELPTNDAKGEATKVHLVGIRRPEDDRIENLEPATGVWFNTPGGDDIVVDQVAADRFNAHVGETFELKGLHASKKSESSASYKSRRYSRHIFQRCMCRWKRCSDF